MYSKPRRPDWWKLWPGERLDGMVEYTSYHAAPKQEPMTPEDIETHLAILEADCVQ